MASVLATRTPVAAPSAARSGAAPRPAGAFHAPRRPLRCGPCRVASIERPQATSAPSLDPIAASLSTEDHVPGQVRRRERAGAPGGRRGRRAQAVARKRPRAPPPTTRGVATRCHRRGAVALCRCVGRCGGVAGAAAASAPAGDNGGARGCRARAAARGRGRAFAPARLRAATPCGEPPGPPGPTALRTAAIRRALTSPVPAPLPPPPAQVWTIHSPTQLQAALDRHGDKLCVLMCKSKSCRPCKSEPPPHERSTSHRRARAARAGHSPPPGPTPPRP
jgi:hypothetical protein